MGFQDGGNSSKALDFLLFCNGSSQGKKTGVCRSINDCWFEYSIYYWYVFYRLLEDSIGKSNDIQNNNFQDPFLP